MNKLIMLPKD